MLGATKNKFRDVNFETVDLTERGGPNSEIAARYGVKGIPYVVFLDSSGTEIYGANPPFEEAAFTALIKQYR